MILKPTFCISCIIAPKSFCKWGRRVALQRQLLTTAYAALLKTTGHMQVENAAVKGLAAACVALNGGDIMTVVPKIYGALAGATKVNPLSYAFD